MKKYLAVAAAAAMVLASCQNAGEELQTINGQQGQEISFVNMMTKGYTTGATFYETASEDIHTAEATTTSRVMNISAYLYAQDGTEKNYFIDKTFKERETTAVWHNYVENTETPIFWPINSKLDFLALSFTKGSKFTDETSNKTLTEKVKFDNSNCASKAVIKVVSGDASQDDILFASKSQQSASDNKAAGVPYDGETTPKTYASACLPLTFQHAQAWIEFALMANQKEVITIEKIELEDIFNGGELTVENNNGNAKATWSFRTEESKNIPMETKATAAGVTANDFGSKLLDSEKPTYFDMLIPEQAKTAFIITYKLLNNAQLESAAQTLTYRFELNHENWLMGYKYVYNITMDAYEITVNPEVKTWDNGDVSDFNPTKIE